MLGRAIATVPKSAPASSTQLIGGCRGRFLDQIETAGIKPKSNILADIPIHYPPPDSNAHPQAAWHFSSSQDGY